MEIVTPMEKDQLSSWQRPFTFDRVVRLLITTLFCLGALWLIKRLSNVLMPFLVAWLVAYLLEPLVQRNRTALHLKGRFVAIVLTLLEVILVITMLCIIFVPSIVDEMKEVGELMHRYTSDGAQVPLVPQSFHDFLRRNIDFEQLRQVLSRIDLQWATNVAARMVSGSVSMILSVVNWLLVLLYIVFIMLDYDKLLKGLVHAVPARYRHSVFSVAGDIKDSMNHYFRGQALVASIVGVLFAVGFAIVGIPLAVVLGLFIGLLNMVPYLQLISIPITTLLCLVYSTQGGVSFWPVWWQCMAVYVVVQCFQDLFLTPKIMGNAMGLNPAIILLSLSVWGSLMGIIGMIIALPLTTLLLAYYSRYVINRSQHTGAHHAPAAEPPEANEAK